MQCTVVFLLLFGVFAPSISAPHEGLPLLNPGGIGGIFKGPDSETIIQGPDGSVITSEEKGGSVVRDQSIRQPIVVAEAEVPLVSPGPLLIEERLVSASPILASPAPVLAPSTQYLASPSPIPYQEYREASRPLLPQEDYIPETPLIAPVLTEAKAIEIVQQDPHIIETEIIEAPDVEPDQASDLKGPSGRIITKGSASVVSGPASTTITEPRKIIIAPPKIVGTPVLATATIPLATVSEASLVGSLAPSAFQAVSTLAPPLLSVSSTVGSYIDTSRIDLGVGGLRQSIPVVEYSSANGVLDEAALVSSGIISSTGIPTLSSPVATINTDRYTPAEGPAVPPAYLLPPAPELLGAPQAAGLVSSNASPYIQKISKIDPSLSVDGRVDMGYPVSEKYSQSVEIPQVLGMALSRFYRKTAKLERSENSIQIDDKLGDLLQNEILTDNQQFLPPSDLSQAKYIAPQLSRNGIDPSKVNLAQVPLSQVSRLPDDAYLTGEENIFGPDLYNRYGRDTKQLTKS